MSPGRTAHPVLRLVDGAADRPRAALPRRIALRQAAGAVERENLAAATLPADDARRIFAARVADALEGGRAAVLPPERRRRLVTRAGVLGLRPFDANLIIAIVQDSARAGSFGAADDGRLAMIPSRPGRPQRRAALGVMAAAGALGIAVFAALVAWLQGP